MKAKNTEAVKLSTFFCKKKKKVKKRKNRNKISDGQQHERLWAPQLDRHMWAHLCIQTYCIPSQQLTSKS